MGGKIEIQLPTVDVKELEGIAQDIVEFLKQYNHFVSYSEIHVSLVIK